MKCAETIVMYSWFDEIISFNWVANEVSKATNNLSISRRRCCWFKHFGIRIRILFYAVSNYSNMRLITGTVFIYETTSVYIYIYITKKRIFILYDEETQCPKGKISDWSRN